jgi:hypothetical protein
VTKPVASTHVRPGDYGLLAIRNEPVKVSLYASGCQARFTYAHSLISIIIAPTTPPLDFIHEKGFEILTKYKEVIRQLHRFVKISVPAL